MPTKSYTDQLLGFDPTTGLPVRIAADSAITLSLADFTLGSGDLTLTSGDTTISGGNLTVSTGDLSIGGDSVLSGNLNVSGNAIINGDLTVGGDIVSRNQVNVTIEDQILDLGLGNTSESAVAGGLTVTMKKASGFTVITATAFDAATRTITVNSVTGLSAGDIIAVSGNQDGYASNNGLFVVQSASSTSVVIKSSPSTSVPFAQNALVDASGQSADLYKVDLAVAIFANGTSAFKDGNGLSWPEGTFLTAYVAGASESQFEANGAYDTSSQTSLQEAYNTRAPADTSSKITTVDGYAIEFSLANGDFIVNGADNVGMDVEGYVRFSADENSHFSVDSAALTLETVTSGVLTVSAAGNLDAHGANVLVDSDGYLNLVADGAFSVDAVGIATLDGAQGVVVTSAAGLDMDAATVLVDSDGYLNLVAGGAFSVDAAGIATLDGAQGVVVTSAAGLDMDAATVLVDSDGYLNLVAGGAFSVDAAGIATLDGAQGVVVTSAAGLDMDAATVLVDSDGYLNLVAGGAFSVDAAGIATLDGAQGVVVTSAAGLDMHGDTVLIDSDGYLNLVSDGYVSIDAYSNFDLTAANIILDSTPDGYVSVLAGSAGFSVDSLDAVIISADAASSFTVSSGNLSFAANDGYIDGYATSGIVLDTDGYVQITADQSIDLSSPAINFTSTSGNITLDAAGPGNIVLDAVGEIQLTATDKTSLVIGDGLAEAFSIKSDGYNYMIVDTDGYSIVFGDEAADQSFDFAGQGVVSMDSLLVTKQAKFADSADPANEDNHGQVYVKAVGSDSELFYFGDNKAVQITQDGFLNVGAMGNAFFTAQGSVAAGDALYLYSATHVAKSDYATAGKQFVVGIALETVSNGQKVRMMAMPGVVISATVASSTTVVVGDEVYLAASGALSNDIPSASGQVIFRVGYALDSASILFQPQLIAFVD